jgi:hypothetical protein
MDACVGGGEKWASTHVAARDENSLESTPLRRKNLRNPEIQYKL